MTYYESAREGRKAYNTVRTDAEKALGAARTAGFPNCKGTYPDCPEKPSKDNKMCRSCPVLDE